MQMQKNNNATRIGVLFTKASILSMVTIVLPMVAILPGTLLESIASLLIDNEPYSNVGWLTITLLSSIFLSVIILSSISVANQTRKYGVISQRRIIFILSIVYFIVHPLGLYIFWGIRLNFRSDGQLIFLVFFYLSRDKSLFYIDGLLD